VRISVRPKLEKVAWIQPWGANVFVHIHEQNNIVAFSLPLLNVIYQIC